VAPRPSRLHVLLDALQAAGRKGVVSTAQALAEALGISIRTLYRDLDRLRAAGVPVEGRTGVGITLVRGAKIPELPAGARSGSVEARVRLTVDGARILAEDPQVAVDRGRGPERTVRAASREAIVRAILRASGEVVALAPERVRRDVRTRAREIARAHKG
jgi:predicted DNA-binding transcriptional regulator YafY